MRDVALLIGELTIPSGNTNSNVIDFRKLPLSGITIFAPAELTGTVKIYVSPSIDSYGTSYWNLLQSGGSDIEIGAGDAVPLDYVGWHHLKLVSGSNEAAARKFILLGVEDIT